MKREKIDEKKMDIGQAAGNARKKMDNLTEICCRFDLHRVHKLVHTHTLYTIYVKTKCSDRLLKKISMN